MYVIYEVAEVFSNRFWKTMQAGDSTETAVYNGLNGGRW
jgi:hypothetical protein